MTVTAARYNQIWRCVVTDGNGNKAESAAAHIIEKVGPEITKDPEDVEARGGDKIELTVEAEGTDLTYQWQFSNNNGSSWSNTKSFTGYNTATITIPVTATRFNQIWRCVVTDGNGNKAESAAAHIIKATTIVLDDVTYPMPQR